MKCEAFWVDVRLRQVTGTWVASADTPDGPSIGVAMAVEAAVRDALEPFAAVADELIASAPLDLHLDRSAIG